MALTAGTRLGPYEITALIGKGGMGEVYRATDTNLKRQVAIKVLPEAFAADAERLARFQREAEVLASLNHPNIAIIHGLEKSAGITALVMELVEGETLAERLLTGEGSGLKAQGSGGLRAQGFGLPMEEAVGIATQIAEALEAAHEQGIIHRDLKPANIKVRPDGTAKVLDFGLAKALDPGSGIRDPGLAESPTITTPAHTMQGAILGTAAYMSPEQARGRPVDKRADIFAFGCVLYEMLTGSRAFQASEVADTLALVLTQEPDWKALPDATAVQVRQLLRRCLARDPRRRLRDIGDARVELQELASGIDTMDSPRGGGTHAIAPDLRGRWLRAGAGALALLAVGVLIGGVGIWRAGQRTVPAEVRRFDVTSRQFEFDPSPGRQGMDVAVTPDGRQVVYSGQATGSPLLYVRSVDRVEPRALAGLGSRQNPFVSADGRWVGFLDGSGNLRKINIDGGPAVTIANVAATALEGASWGPDDNIVFATNTSTGLLRVSAEGGTVEPLTSPDLAAGEAEHRYPDLLPDGRTVLFTVIDTSGSIDNAQVVALDLESGERTVLLRGAGQARYVPTGHLLFGVSGELRVVRFDASTLTVSGLPVRVVEGVVTTELGGANFAVARDGTLVYVAGAALARRELVWIDRQGREERVETGARAFAQVRISPDGTRAAVDIRDQQNDIWIWNIKGETLTRLTVDPLLDRQPIWSPDGRYLVFTSDRAGAVNLFRMPADGTGDAEPLTEGPGAPYATSFSPDGTELVFWRTNASTGLDVAALRIGEQPGFTTLVATNFDERNAELSPDGRWLAYQSNESGRYEVYVQPFPGLDEGRWQLSSDGGTRPFWSRDGRELFFWVEPGRLMVMPVEQVPAGSPFPRRTPQVLLEGDYIQPLNSRTHDITPDGQRFLVIKNASDPSSRPIVVLVQNFVNELRRLVPDP